MTLATARLTRAFCILVVANSLLGCELATLIAEDEDEPGLDDGSFCTENDECESGTCTSSQLCAHSWCECPGDTCAGSGDPSPDCNKDWVCTDNKFFDGFREFFGGDPAENRGYCQAPCAPGCPEHYVCEGGQFCLPDRQWAAPVPTIQWTGAASGTLTGKSATETVTVEEDQAVVLSASATSPTKTDIQSLRWNLVTGSGTVESTEASVEVMVPAGSFLRAELSVLDERSRTGFASVIFEPCGGAGKTCGYEGSGCCNGCADATNTCM